MEEVTLKKTKEIAAIANLSLTETELRQYQGELNSIFEYVHKLAEVDTTNVEPAALTNGLVNVFREDVLKPSLPIEQVLSASKQVSDGVFTVKAVLE